MRWSRPGRRCGPLLSSAVTQPAIGCPTTVTVRFQAAADRVSGVFPMPAPQRPQPRPGVLSISAYVPGKSSAPGVARVFKLSSNETPLGASPQAIEAYRAAADTLHDYPDGTATALREAIGRVYGLDPNRIICGAGSDELLNLLAHAFLAPGDEA